MILDRHWWKTADGRLVPDGDPAARILVYPRGHEVPDHLAEKVGLMAAAKQAEQPANKMAAKSTDKSAELLACDHLGCTATAKSPAGLAAHKRSHNGDQE